MRRSEDFNQGLIWNSMELPIPIDRFEYGTVPTHLAKLRKEDIRFWITRHPSVELGVFDEIIGRVEPVCIRFSSSKYTSPDLLNDDVHYFARQHSRIERCLDVSGPKVRISDLQSAPSTTVPDLPLYAGDHVLLISARNSGRRAVADHLRIPVVYVTEAIHAKSNDVIMISDGWSQLKVLEVNEDWYVLEALHNTVLSIHRGVDVPGMYEEIDSTDDTISYLMTNRYSTELVNSIAISFVNDADVPRKVRGAFDDKRIVAKIETRRGLENLRGIADVSDSVMLARGDLAVQMARLQVDTLEIENRARDVCLQMSKEFIIATRIADSLDEGGMRDHEIYRLYVELSRSLPITFMLTNEISSSRTALDNVDKLLKQIEALKG